MWPVARETMLCSDLIVVVYLFYFFMLTGSVAWLCGGGGLGGLQWAVWWLWWGRTGRFAAIYWLLSLTLCDWRNDCCPLQVSKWKLKQLYYCCQKRFINLEYIF